MTALTPAEAAASITGRIAIDGLDHLVLTVRDVDATIAFYAGALGMREATLDDGRRALHFGSQQLHLQQAGAEAPQGAGAATPGSADLCLVTSTPVEGVLRVLGDHGVPVEHGPLERVGASGQLLSVYVRDPDGNLVELANRCDTPS